MIKAVIDRVEGEWLVTVPESGPVFNLPRSLFPDIREGNHVVITVEHDKQGEKATMERIAQARSGLNRTPL